ncbi:MAG: hypothetical protein ACRELD_05120 [Longimicrobiales bacterium]
MARAALLTLMFALACDGAGERAPSTTNRAPEASARPPDSPIVEPVDSSVLLELPADSVSATRPEPSPSTSPDAGNLVPRTLIERMPRTMLASHRIDVDADDDLEVVELWVDAARDSAGELMFDDGQVWGVFIRDGGQLHPLFHGFVQLGHVELSIITRGEDTPALVVTRVQGAAHTVEVFAYSSRGFIREQALEVVGNRVFDTR